ncbi:MAG: UDP-N-acetylglucosamine 2-epimerase (non-hydrolyzing), partial [Actinomycetota bacterium]|nr:UDP-N-acetylglucosamine 2-epimerase (non-hydrolyzing) [Actinomycetota bacterium]
MKALFVFGTRPEAIKIAPVVQALKASPMFDVNVCVTAQHREILDEVLTIFDISPDYDLDIMQPGQTLTEISTRALSGLGAVIEQAGPDIVLVQGDTTTTFAAALSALYHKVPVAHIEAGYRTGDLYQPFPEEANRRLVSEIAKWHFAVNEGCRGHLLREGHADADI